MLTPDTLDPDFSDPDVLLEEEQERGISLWNDDESDLLDEADELVEDEETDLDLPWVDEVELD